MLNPGDQAPSFELNQPGGRPVEVGPDGKAAVIAFFATDCDSSCKAIPCLNNFAAHAALKGGRVIAVSQDNKKQTLAFLEGHPCGFPVLTDRGLKASLAFDPERVPAFFLLDGEFKVVRRQTSFNKAGVNSIAREMCEMLGMGYEPIALEHDGIPDFMPGSAGRQRDLDTIVEDERRYLGGEDENGRGGGSEAAATEVDADPLREAVPVGASTQAHAVPRGEPFSPMQSAMAALEEEVVVQVMEPATAVAEETPVPSPEESPIRLAEEEPAVAPADGNGSHAPATEKSAGEVGTESASPPVPEDEPQAAEEEIEIGDGLPMVEPSFEQLESFIAALHHSRDEVLGSFCGGEMPVTVEFAAQFAARAGCSPDQMGAFAALVAAAADPAFKLGAFRGSLLALEPLVIVNGPVRARLGLASGRAALSGVSPAGLALGRAFGLLGRTVCAASHAPETRSLGHPGRLSCVLAENQEASPWEPFIEEMGLAAGSSGLALLAAEAPVTFWEPNPADGLPVLDALARLLASLWNPKLCGVGDVLIALCPAHARAVSLGGMDKAAARRWLFDHAIVSAHDVEEAAEGGAADPETEPLISGGQPAWRKFRALDSIRIIVAGDDQSQTSVVFPALISERSGGAVVCAKIV